jgi:hypothetical protein
MKLRFPDFMTTAQDGGKVVSLTHLPPLPQEIHLALISVSEVKQSHYGLEWPRVFQEVKVPRYHDNGTGWR